MPYDRFVKLQIAGDELEPDSPFAMTATGFLAAGVQPPIKAIARQAATTVRMADLKGGLDVCIYGMVFALARSLPMPSFSINS